MGRRSYCSAFLCPPQAAIASAPPPLHLVAILYSRQLKRTPRKPIFSRCNCLSSRRLAHLETVSRYRLSVFRSSGSFLQEGHPTPQQQESEYRIHSQSCIQESIIPCPSTLQPWFIDSETVTFTIHSQPHPFSPSKTPSSPEKWATTPPTLNGHQSRRFPWTMAPSPELSRWQRLPIRSSTPRRRRICAP